MAKETRYRPVRKPVGVSRTEQSHKDRCDANKIVARYMRSGVLDEQMKGGLYGDFTSVSDYHTCVQKVCDARNDFMALPSSIRKRFEHDPAKVIEFLNDPANFDEAVALGMIPRPPVEEPVEEPVTVPEPAPEP